MMKVFVLFILCSNYLIHPNVAVKNHQYQSSLSKDSVEGDLSDLYEIDDDYSEDLGNIYYLNFIVSNYVKQGRTLRNLNPISYIFDLNLI